MFEYWIYADNDSVINSLFRDEFIERKNEEFLEANYERIWYFKATNLFVIQSDVSFGDGNLLLDELLIKLAKSYEIHDKGIIKSCWHASSLH